MAGSPHPKILHHPLHSFSLKSTSSSTQLTSSKLKNVIQTFIFSQLYRIARALAKAKSIVIQVLKDIQLLQFIQLSMKKSSKGLKNKLFLGSFRLHYNWCSPHVLPVPMPQLDHQGYHSSSNDWYYDSSWNSTTDIPSTDSSEDFMVAHQELHSSSSQLTGYLHWLEEREDRPHHHHNSDNDIDKLADMFIANSHEKFRLEKQESYRRFQEMMDRSI